MSEAPDLAAPVAGWRVWVLADGPAGPQLVSPMRPAVWSPRAATTASCHLGCEQPPSFTCRCGLYALADVGHLSPLGLRHPLVVGCVALWGRVVQHARGWRGELGYPLVLFTSSDPLAGHGSRSAQLLRARRAARLGVVPAARPPFGASENLGLEDTVDRVLSRRYGVPVYAVPGGGPGGSPEASGRAVAVRDEAARGLAARRLGDRDADERFSRTVEHMLDALR